MNIAKLLVSSRNLISGRGNQAVLDGGFARSVYRNEANHHHGPGDEDDAILIIRVRLGRFGDQDCLGADSGSAEGV